MGYDFVSNESWLKQEDLFGSGQKVYLLSDTVSFNRESNTGHRPVTKVPITETGEIVGDSTNYERRKGVNVYNGLGNLQITVNGKINLRELGSLSDDYVTITPGLFYTIVVNGHRKYRFMDSKIGSAWVSDPDPLGVVQSPYNYSDGIPVVLTNYTLNSGLSENQLTYNMVFREDRE